VKDKPKIRRAPLLSWMLALAAAIGVRGNHSVPYSELSVKSSYRSRYAFGFDTHKAKLRAIKDRRRTDRR